MTPKIRVAISGSGVAGASLLRALLQYPHIDVHIFEAAPTFRESAGQCFGLARNATAAMKLMDAMPCLERAGGVPMRGVCFCRGQAEDAGFVVFEQDNEVLKKPSTTIVHRANIVQEFLAGAPKDRMHTSRKLERYERQADGSVLLYFKDGSTHECDILVGADGIHSAVRTMILGKDDPAATPINTGLWAILTLHPYAKARSSIGEGPIDIQDARELAWAGKGLFMMSNILDKGETVQLAIAGYDEDMQGTTEWRRPVTAEELKKRFVGQAWMPHVEKAVVELLCNEPQQQGIYLWEHRPARTYVDGPVCMTGDAAHSTTPFQGSGAGISVEDSLILSKLLGRATSPKEAQTALRVYDHFRRPRTQRVVESSKEVAWLFLDQRGLNAEQTKEQLEHRWDHIIDMDVPKHLDDALKMMEVELAA